MLHELSMYLLLVMFAGTLSTLLCLYGYFKLKDAPGAKYYTLSTFLSSIFTFSYAFELSSKTLEQMKLWLMIEYLAMPFIPLCVLLMCFHYVGHKIKLWITYSLCLIPSITIFMHGTNDFHHFYYKSMGIRIDTPFPILELEPGLWFYVHSIFLFLCLMVSILILLFQLLNSSYRFRMQTILLVIGLIFPIIANYFYVNGLSPYGIDLGPVSMSISFIFHGFALFSFQMFNVAPIARDTVFENMKEGVIVTNQKGLLVDYNHKMLSIIPS